MKSLITLFLFSGFIHVAGQEPIEVKIENRPTSQGMHPAFEVMVPQATPDDAIDVLKKDFLPGGLFKKNAKVEKVKDEWQVDDVLLEDISPKPLDMITQVSSFPGHIYVQFFFRDGGSFLGSEDTSAQLTEAASKFVRNYGVELYRYVVENELKEEEKELRKLENDLDKLESKNKNFDNRIDDARSDQKDFDDEADDQREDLRQAKKSDEVSSEQFDEMEKDLKSAEKDLRKAKKEEAKFERKMDKNEREQREIQYQIERQEETIEKVKEKLDNIR